MQQFYINVLNSKYGSFSTAFKKYDPETESFRIARLLFVRKAHNTEDNIIGTDHGYIESDKKKNIYCRLVRVAFVADPYRKQVGGTNNTNYNWLDGENYKNTYYN